MSARPKPLGDLDTTSRQAAAVEILRQIEPLIGLAQKNSMTFMAYLLSMAMEEARRIATGIPGCNKSE